MEYTPDLQASHSALFVHVLCLTPVCLSWTPDPHNLFQTPTADMDELSSILQVPVVAGTVNRGSEGVKLPTLISAPSLSRRITLITAQWGTIAMDGRGRAANPQINKFLRAMGCLKGARNRAKMGCRASDVTSCAPF